MQETCSSVSFKVSFCHRLTDRFNALNNHQGGDADGELLGMRADTCPCVDLTPWLLHLSLSAQICICPFWQSVSLISPLTFPWLWHLVNWRWQATLEQVNKTTWSHDFHVHWLFKLCVFLQLVSPVECLRTLSEPLSREPLRSPSDREDRISLCLSLLFTCRYYRGKACTGSGERKGIRVTQRQWLPTAGFTLW